MSQEMENWHVIEFVGTCKQFKLEWTGHKKILIIIPSFYFIFISQNHGFFTLITRFSTLVFFKKFIICDLYLIGIDVHIVDSNVTVVELLFVS